MLDSGSRCQRPAVTGDVRMRDVMAGDTNAADAQAAQSRLSRGSFVPLYYQLQEVIKQEIESGNWEPNTKLPSESELCERFGVSRVVVRQALEILKKDGQIESVRGVGSFVSAPKLEPVVGGLARVLSIPDNRTSIEVIDRSMTTVEPFVESKLGIERLETVCNVEWRWSFDGTPLSVGHSFFRVIDTDWFEEFAKRPTPFEPITGGWPVRLAPAEAGIEASTTGQFSSEQLGLDVGAPLFLISATETLVDSSATRTPFEFARIGFRADILAFKMAAGGTDGEGPMAVTMSLQ